MRYGKIGIDGQTILKELAFSGTAIANSDKFVIQKKKVGYVDAPK